MPGDVAYCAGYLSLKALEKTGEVELRNGHNTLNGAQRQRLLITCKHIDKLLGDIEATLNAAGSKTVFPSYVNDLTPAQRKTIEDYIARVRGQLLQVLAGESLTPEPPRISAAHSIHVNLSFVDIAIAELSPHYMRGYGPVSEEGATDLNGIVAELRSAIKELTRYVLQPQAGDLRERVEKLANQGWDVEGLQKLANIIDRNGLTEFRSTITMLLDRAEDTALEIAVFGRVSTGKSSLLNHVIGADLLPVGVTPITAVPTRIGYGQKPLVTVWQEGVGASTHTVEELPSFVDERLNPENRKRVGRILVLYPSERLREGILFVDTPGVGSLATRGASETLAYLPRCDAGIVLVDAGSTLTPDDLNILRALTQVGTLTTVLVSKADLLSEKDLEQQIAYIRTQLRSEFETELSVRPVSVMPTHAELLDRWFVEDLSPLYERKQRLLQESLARKTLLLAGAVRSTLEALARYPQAEGEDRVRLEEIDLELRRTVGHLQTFQTELRRRTDEIPRLSAFILEKSAESVADLWNSEREVDCAEVLRSTAAEVALAVADEIRGQLSRARELLQHELSKAATLLKSADLPREEDFQVLAEMPVFHMNRQSEYARRPVSGSLGKWFRVREAVRILNPYEPVLEQALGSFSRLLYSWGVDAGTDLERRFDSFANRYRAQLERLLLDRKRPTVDSERISSDLEDLSRMFVAEMPATGNEAMAS
jgi:GTP-binding protein EngB required for normal cell division